MSGAAITAALAQGKNLILSPGVYDLNQPIVVPHPDTVVLGLGMATLVPQHGNAAMKVVPNRGVKLSGLIIDAGPVNSPVLVSVGRPGPSRQRPRPHPGCLLPHRRRRDHARLGDRQPARQRRELDHRRRVGLAR